MSRAERREVWTVAVLAALTLMTLAFAPPVFGWDVGLRIAVGVFLALPVAAIVIAVRRHRRDGGGW